MKATDLAKIFDEQVEDLDLEWRMSGDHVESVVLQKISLALDSMADALRRDCVDKPLGEDATVVTEPLPASWGHDGGPRPGATVPQVPETRIATPPAQGREVIRGRLVEIVRYARATVPTARDHAGWPNHRADELVRDLLEEVLAQ